MMQCQSHLAKNKVHFSATCDIKKKVHRSGWYVLHVENEIVLELN